MATGPGFQTWRYRSDSPELSWVYPDGCRDVLIVSRPGGRMQVLLTDFDLRPRAVQLEAGTEIIGYRLRPGAVASGAMLRAIAANEARAAEILGDGMWSDDIDQVIVALTGADATVRSVARGCGVSVRTLQRRFGDFDLPPPEYWRLLARARRAVSMLGVDASLADIATANGFSDQAHMTRDLVRWFGEPPARIRRDENLRAILAQPALGNWTGEQISTR